MNKKQISKKEIVEIDQAAKGIFALPHDQGNNDEMTKMAISKLRSRNSRIIRKRVLKNTLLK